ncbi:MAG: hypothetical protein MHM6MM_005730 [Cercozoa sp. M6MM]
MHRVMSTLRGGGLVSSSRALSRSVITVHQTVGEKTVKLTLSQGDIFDVCARNEVQAIVNPANSRMMHGGGLARLIADAAGPMLYRLHEAENHYCPEGEAVATPSFGVKTKCPDTTHILHTVGPSDYSAPEKARQVELLANCVNNTTRLALKEDLTSLAFPAISTGIFGISFETSAEGMLHGLSQFTQHFLAKDDEHHQKEVHVHFVLLKERPDLTKFQQALEQQVQRGVWQRCE